MAAGNFPRHDTVTLVSEHQPLRPPKDHLEGGDPRGPRLTRAQHGVPKLVVGLRRFTHTTSTSLVLLWREIAAQFLEELLIA